MSDRAKPAFPWGRNRLVKAGAHGVNRCQTPDRSRPGKSRLASRIPPLGRGVSA